MNPEQPQISGLPLPQSSTPVGGYSFSASPVVAPISAQGDNQSRVPSAASIPRPAGPVHDSMMPPAAQIVVTDTSDSDETNDVDEAWIAKAREIVTQTRDDPYSQSLALARMKIDYLKSRYNKDIKMAEATAQ